MAERALVGIQVTEGLATLRLQSPEKRNALSPELIAAFRGALRQIKNDSRVRAVVIAGTAGGAFCAGADLRAVLSLENDQITSYFEEMATLIWEVIDCHLPTVAAVGGPAMGGGADIAVACDLRVAAPKAIFAFPGLSFGLVLGTQQLARLIGPSRAKQMAFLGKRVDAQEALNMGLVDLIADDPELAALDLAREMAQRPPHALAMAKTLLKPAANPEEVIGPVRASVRHPEFLDQLRAYASARLKPASTHQNR
ncbi:MAG: enoyl-CoA hydratase/isomerase family protein [Chloroflexota bacterium]|jgi:enoyl-CoA hydratase/carnithine racemase